MIRTKITGFVAALVLLLSTSAVAVADGDPQAVVQSTIDRMLEIIKGRKQELEANPGLINGLVEDIIVPRFDFIAIARSALGKHWHGATEEQRSTFAAAFKSLLVRTYCRAVLNYSGQDVEYLPTKAADNRGVATVYTLVNEPGGPKIPINYRLHSVNGEWQVFDVIIDGISLIVNYRKQFDGEIRRGRIEGLIASLEQRNKNVSGHE